MKPLLITCVGVRHDLALLPHWVRHYLDLGIRSEDFRVILNTDDTDDPKLVQAVQTLSELGISGVIRWIAPYTSATMWEQRRAVQQEAAPGQWILNADVDEYHEYPELLHAFLERCDTMGVDCVQGPFIDRLAPEGVLASVSETPSVLEQFPVMADVIWQLAGRGAAHDRAGTVKIMATKQNILPSRGGHHPLKECDPSFLYGMPLARFPGIEKPGFRFSLPTRVHHIHWTDSLPDRLRKRMNTPGASEAGTEYGRKQLEHIERNGGINLSLVATSEAPLPRDWQTRAEELRAEAKRRKRFSSVYNAVDSVRARIPL